MTHRVSELLLRHAPDANVVLFFCDNEVCTGSFRNCTTQVLPGDDYDWAVRLQCTVCQSVWWICNECPLRKKIHEHHVLCRHQYTFHGKSKNKHNRNRSLNNECNERNANERNDTLDMERNDTVDSIEGGTLSIAETVVAVEPTTNEPASIEVAGVSVAVEETQEIVTATEETQMDVEDGVSDDVEFVSQEEVAAIQFNVDMMDYVRPVALRNDPDNVYINYTRDVRSPSTYNLKSINQSKKYLNEVRSELIDDLTTMSSIHPPSNKNVSEFYSFDILSSGKRFLISKMCSGEHGTVIDIMKKITDKEVDCQLLISDFVCSLTRDQQCQFGKVMDSVMKVYYQSDDFIYYPPKTIADMRRMYIDGHQSVLKNLPIPNVSKLKNHSYVSLMDCISDFLLRQKENIMTLDEYHSKGKDKNDLSIFSSDRVVEIIQEAIDRDEEHDEVQGELDVVVLFLKVWSDDFDPNSSIKSNRQSVWVKTVTIFAMSYDGSKVTATYPVATAPKGVDHTEIEHVFGKELKRMNSDQPERRTNLRLAAGNSVHHKRFGYLTDYNQCMNVIRSCKECTILINDEVNEYRDTRIIMVKDSKWREGKCDKCTCWMYPKYDKLLSYTPEKAYPPSKVGKDGKVSMKVIKRKNLMSCLDDVNLAIERNIWTSTQCRAYLRTSSFHTKAIEDIIEGATNNKNLWEAEELKDEEPHQWLTIKTDRDNDPRKYEIWELPPSWYKEETTDLFADVPMHLLLLGLARVNPNLETPRSTWLGKENKFWLEVRGLSTEGKVKELKERVEHYYNMDPQPAVLETTIIGVDDIMAMINALNVMISLVLSKHTKYENISYLEATIRHFLICYDKVDEAMTTKNEKPSWLTSYNFLCLLNLPDVMAKFGCLRNIWEGGIEGEGFLRKYKRELKFGLRSHWQMYAMINLLRRGVYDGEIFPQTTKWKVELSKECRVYNTYKTMMMVIMSGEPISAISMASNKDNENDVEKLFMVYRTNKRKMKAWLWDIDWENAEEYCHMKYYSITLSSINIDMDEDIAKKATVCLLLPKITQTNGFVPKTTSTKYCIVYSDWRL